MKKKFVIIAVVIVLLSVACVSLFQYGSFKNEKLEVMCKSSINSALEHFEEYSSSAKESDYIAGVAEFRTYMTAYLCLNDSSGDTDYLWCNILYGYMTLSPEKVKSNVSELVTALGYLAEDYDHPNGFNLIHNLNNQLMLD